MAEEKVVEIVDAPKQRIGEVVVKPLSENGFVAFWQKIWRVILGWWCTFEYKHPKFAGFLMQFVVFWLISNLVTIFQLIVFAFMPHILGIELAGTPWYFPEPINLGFQVKNAAGEMVDALWWIVGYDVLYNKAGEVIIGGGLGYTIAFATGTFLAQCINFPMQRNITYRSHGNPWWQAMWYVIGWLLVNVFSMALNNFVHLWVQQFAPWVSLLLDTFLMGTISIAVFFFLFKIIFPDLHMQEKAEAKRLAAAIEKGAPADKIAKLEAKHADTVKQMELADADKVRFQAQKMADSKALAWDSFKKTYAKLEAKEGVTQEELDAAKKVLADRYAEAQQAAGARDEAIEAELACKQKHGVA